MLEYGVYLRSLIVIIAVYSLLHIPVFSKIYTCREVLLLIYL
jgi:hypothetical protein